jgi:hypothetical protein
MAGQSNFSFFPIFDLPVGFLTNCENPVDKIYVLPNSVHHFLLSRAAAEEELKENPLFRRGRCEPSVVTQNRPFVVI